MNEDTGEVRVVRYVAAHDSGRIVNPTLALNQVEGGVSQMLGFALSEEMLTDAPSGATLNASFLEHKSPTILEYPRYSGDFRGRGRPDRSLRREGAGGAAEHRGRARRDERHSGRYRRGGERPARHAAAHPRPSGTAGAFASVKPFRIHTARTLDGARQALLNADERGAAIIAGGADLLGEMKEGNSRAFHARGYKHARLGRDGRRRGRRIQRRLARRSRSRGLRRAAR